MSPTAWMRAARRVAARRPGLPGHSGPSGLCGVLVSVLVATVGAIPALAQPPSDLDLKPRPKPTNECVVRDEDVSFLTDQGLTMKLLTRLQFNRELLTEKIEARVVGGVAILEGRIATPKLADTAVRLAGETAGVRCVINEMTVVEGRPDTRD